MRSVLSDTDADCANIVKCSCSDLWGLVNNAGVFYAAELEMTSETLFRETLDVNLLGMLRVTQTFLPMIRQARGRVVNVSSVTGA